MVLLYKAPWISLNSTWSTEMITRNCLRSLSWIMNLRNTWIRKYGKLGICIAFWFAVKLQKERDWTSLTWVKETSQLENKYPDNQSNGIMTEAETKTLKTETENTKATVMESTISKDPINLQDVITTEKI